MDDFTTRLEALMRRYAAACAQGEGDGAQLQEQFRKELQLLSHNTGNLRSTRRLMRRCRMGCGRPSPSIDPTMLWRTWPRPPTVRCSTHGNIRCGTTIRSPLRHSGVIIPAFVEE